MSRRSMKGRFDRIPEDGMGRPTLNGHPMPACFCTGGCMRDFNAPGAPERSGVNGLCEECLETQQQAGGGP